MDYRQNKRMPGRLTLLIYRRGLLVATGMLRNISQRGLFISTNCQDLDLNQKLEIEFRLHDPDAPEPQRVSAVLVHKNSRGLGVEFASKEQADSPEVRSLLRWVKSTNHLIPRTPYFRTAAL
ncbi:MAG: PilZ domain-containing protein [Marinobacter sp.]|uniref:PilZ domain-containing protein n=1 Tax=Marinobacter sp. TaxID=50741 RepID=UPI00299E3D53|nr:PilZ domain-containing protein [Marinobacter sp.]MDX1755060.1 PilZ domain-containing protein [Marinobacter sp.]